MKYVGLDAGYYTTPLCKGICDRGVQPVIATRLGPHEKDKYTINSFIYIEEWDVYACPNDCFLNYRTTRRHVWEEFKEASKDVIAIIFYRKPFKGNIDKDKALQFCKALSTISRYLKIPYFYMLSFTTGLIAHCIIF